MKLNKINIIFIKLLPFFVDSKNDEVYEGTLLYRRYRVSITIKTMDYRKYYGP